jgi:hypothetical protein
MFHFKMLELESELLAKELAAQGVGQLPYECELLLQFVENEVEVKLANPVPSSWRGWLTYRRGKDSLIVMRGKAFADGGMFGKWRAGVDVPYGHDTVTEYERHFDVTPPGELDYLLINFGGQDNPKVFLWYGENIAAHKLIFTADIADNPQKELTDAVVEACTWILKRPKEITLLEFLKEIQAKQQGRNR